MINKLHLISQNKIHKNNGQTLLAFIIFFVAISLSVIIGAGVPAAIEFSGASELLLSKRSYYLAESGVEDLVYRIKTAKNYDLTENLNIEGLIASTTISNLPDDEKEIISAADVMSLIKKIESNLMTGDGAAFNYGVQAGDGGFVMENNSLVNGNIYSNGPVSGQNSNLIKGDLISAGTTGSADGVHSTSSVYAHNISNSTIDNDAYYVNINNTTVVGTTYPGSPDQLKTDLPISDTIILNWENEATTTVLSSPCPYTINSATSLGFVKITCDLQIKGSAEVTLTGPVWVTGNIGIENNALIKIDSSLGKKSVAIIADNPSNRITNSKIEFQNSAVFQNSGTKGSYILAISQNNSAESGGDEKAITAENSVSGDLLAYAGHGEILLKNSVSLREVTAYRIRLQNTASVTYETGLASLIFKSGPGGGYKIKGLFEIR